MQRPQGEAGRLPAGRALEDAELEPERRCGQALQDPAEVEGNRRELLDTTMAPPPPRPILERPPFSMPPFRLAVRVAASGREAREVGNILHRTRVGTRGSLYDTIRPASERAAAVYTMGATETPPRSGAVHYDIFYSPRPDAPEPATTPPSVLVPRLQRATVRIAKGKQPVRRQHRQQDGHRLLEADGPGERRPA